MTFCTATILIEQELRKSTTLHWFFQLFMDKIVKLRASVSDWLCTLSALLPSHLSFPAHNGLALNRLDPVTAHTRQLYVTNALSLYHKDQSLDYNSFLFNTSLLSTIAQSHQILQQQYADDTQLYVALSPLNFCNKVGTLQSCLSSTHVWLCESSMALNITKSDDTFFGTSQCLNTVWSHTS